MKKTVDNHITKKILKTNKMEKKLTAVEWLETKVNGMIENGGDADLLAVIEHIQQAKEMEKEQIISANADHCYPTFEIARLDAKEYYNENYK